MQWRLYSYAVEIVLLCSGDQQDAAGSCAVCVEAAVLPGPACDHSYNQLAEKRLYKVACWPVEAVWLVDFTAGCVQHGQASVS